MPRLKVIASAKAKGYSKCQRLKTIARAKSYTKSQGKQGLRVIPRAKGSKG